jgi:ribosomal protein L36
MYQRIDRFDNKQMDRLSPEFDSSLSFHCHSRDQFVHRRNVVHVYCVGSVIFDSSSFDNSSRSRSRSWMVMVINTVFG